MVPVLLSGPVVVEPVVVGVDDVPGWGTVTVSWSPPPPPAASVTSRLTVHTPAVLNWTFGAAWLEGAAPPPKFQL